MDQTMERSFYREAPANASHAQTQGLAGWILQWMRQKKSQRGLQRRHLRLIETLPLGGKRQLMLVECDGQNFLVGGNLESVHAIVQLNDAADRELVPSSAEEGYR